jgi:hypothetical protein
MLSEKIAGITIELDFVSGIANAIIAKNKMTNFI